MTKAFPIIVKPMQSAGSDGVKLYHSVEETRYPPAGAELTA
jgi:biotin carboxylase